MVKFVPYEKLSKRNQHEIDHLRRRAWGTMNPVTRKPENSKAYKRQHAKDWLKDDSQTSADFLLLL